MSDGQQSDSTDSRRFTCPKCGRNTMRRVSRTGFLQKRIYSYFGFYPWGCSVCGFARLYKNRGHRKSRGRHRTTEETS